MTLEVEERKIIGGRIRWALVTRYGTLVRAAIECGQPLRSLHRYTSGEVMPGAEILAILARAGISVDWLLTGVGEPFRDE